MCRPFHSREVIKPANICPLTHLDHPKNPFSLRAEADIDSLLIRRKSTFHVINIIWTGLFCTGGEGERPPSMRSCTFSSSSILFSSPAAPPSLVWRLWRCLPTSSSDPGAAELFQTQKHATFTPEQTFLSLQIPQRKQKVEKKKWHLCLISTVQSVQHCIHTEAVKRYESYPHY